MQDYFSPTVNGRFVLIRKISFLVSFFFDILAKLILTSTYCVTSYSSSSSSSRSS